MVLGLVWALSSFSVWELPLASERSSLRVSAGESATAIRFRFWLALRHGFPLPLHPPSTVSLQREESHAWLAAGRRFRIRQSRDLERYLTKRCSPDLTRPWLPHSSESALRS